jgi:hypothetical protein
MIRIFSVGVVCLISLLFTACTAKVYVIDRHTVMEDEAAGEWPDFEKEILNKSKQMGPTSFQKVPINARKKRLYNVLNGEPNESALSAKLEKKK